MSFKSFLKKAGEDFKKGLDVILEYKGAEEAAVSFFAPALGPVFNATVNAVVTAEQSFAAIGKQTGTGAAKLAAVVSVVGGLIQQALADAGRAANQTAVENYINAVVTILNAAPAQS